MPVNTAVAEERRQGERRHDYPDILAKLNEIQLKMDQQHAAFERHIVETQEITELWLHSRWLLNALKYIAALAAVLVAGWIAVKQLIGVH